MNRSAHSFSKPATRLSSGSERHAVGIDDSFVTPVVTRVLDKLAKGGLSRREPARWQFKGRIAVSWVSSSSLSPHAFPPLKGLYLAIRNASAVVHSRSEVFTLMPFISYSVKAIPCSNLSVYVSASSSRAGPLLWSGYSSLFSTVTNFRTTLKAIATLHALLTPADGLAPRCNPTIASLW